MADGQTKAPWHLWLVGVLATLWNGFGAFDFTATFSRFEAWTSNVPQPMLDYIYALPPWMWIGWALGVWGGFYRLGAAADAQQAGRVGLRAFAPRRGRL